MFNFGLPFFQLSLASMLIMLAVRANSTRSVLQSKTRKLFNSYLETLFSSAGYKYDLDSILRIVLSLVLVSAVIGLVFSPFVALLLPLVSLSVGVLFLNKRARGVAWENSRVNDEVCFFIARSLRSGQTLENAILLTTREYPVSMVISEIGKHLNAGMSLVGAIDHIAKQNGKRFNSIEKTLCATISLAQQMGGNSARVFERIGDNFHQSYELVEDTKAALAQVNLSVYVISMLPVAMFGFSFLLGSESALFLFTNPIGLICFALGISLEFCGIIWMKQLVDNGVKTWSL